MRHVRMIMLKYEVINHLDGPDSCSLLADSNNSLSFSSKIQLNTGLFCRYKCERKNTFCFVFSVFCTCHKILTVPMFFCWNSDLSSFRYSMWCANNSLSSQVTSEYCCVQACHFHDYSLMNMTSFPLEKEWGCRAKLNWNDTGGHGVKIKSQSLVAHSC